MNKYTHGVTYRNNYGRVLAASITYGRILINGVVIAADNGGLPGTIWIPPAATFCFEADDPEKSMIVVEEMKTAPEARAVSIVSKLDDARHRLQMLEIERQQAEDRFDAFIFELVAPALEDGFSTEEDRWTYSEKELADLLVKKFFRTERGMQILRAVELMREAIPFVGYDGVSCEDIKENMRAASLALFGE